MTHVTSLRFLVRNMVQMSATTLPLMQAARDYGKGYVFERCNEDSL